MVKRPAGTRSTPSLEMTGPETPGMFLSRSSAAIRGWCSRAPESPREAHIYASTGHNSEQTPLGTGHIQVMRVQRVRTRLHPPRGDDPDHALVRGVVLLEGKPLNPTSSVRRARIAFTDPWVEPPPSRCERDRGLLQLYYPSHEYHAVMELLNSKADRLCYFWCSRDRMHSLVMLMLTTPR